MCLVIFNIIYLDLLFFNVVDHTLRPLSDIMPPFSNTVQEIELMSEEELKAWKETIERDYTKTSNSTLGRYVANREYKLMMFRITKENLIMSGTLMNKLVPLARYYQQNEEVEVIRRMHWNLRDQMTKMILSFMGNESQVYEVAGMSLTLGGHSHLFLI